MDGRQRFGPEDKRRMDMDGRSKYEHNGKGENSPMQGVVEASEPSADERAERSAIGDPGGSEEVSLSRVFGILKNSRRRRVIRYLRRQEAQVTVSDLAEHIAAIENDTEPAKLSSKQRKRVYVGLYQCHLPKMDDAGVIEYDKDRGTIEFGENAPAFEAYLESALDLDAIDEPTGERRTGADEERTEPTPDAGGVHDAGSRDEGLRAAVETGREPATPNRYGYVVVASVVGAVVLLLRRLSSLRDEEDAGESTGEPTDEPTGEPTDEPAGGSDRGVKWALGPRVKR
jgi:hypothetical protein